MSRLLIDTKEDFVAAVAHWDGERQPWWRQAARRAVERGWYRLIPTRKPGLLYLARFWLSKPLRVEGEGDGSEGFESGDSVMLHWFLRPDDDFALHDHPWETFETTILSGWYQENLPPVDWPEDAIGGPPWNARYSCRYEGETVVHRGRDLHCVSALDARSDTWSLIRTGARVRPWGFHPPGQLWVPWKEFLAAAEAKAPAAAPIAVVDGYTQSQPSKHSNHSAGTSA